MIQHRNNPRQFLLNKIMQEIKKYKCEYFETYIKRKIIINRKVLEASVQ